MADIKGRTIAATYGKLLYTSTDDGLVGNTGSTTSVVTTDDMDGTSTASCLNLGIDRVGIGTAAPETKFTIDQTAAHNDGLRIYGYSGQASNYGELYLDSNGYTNLVSEGTRSLLLRSGSSMQFIVDEGDAADTAVIITDASLVGIGDATPSNLLGILSATSPQFRITHTEDTDYATFAVDGDGQLDITTVDGGGAGGHICLMPDGNVGIGTTTPASNLHVYGSGAITAIIGSSDAGGVSLVLDGDSDGDGAGSDYSYINHDTAGILNIVQDSPSGTNTINFGTAGTEDKIVIDANGRLGIQETTPDELLHITSSTASKPVIKLENTNTDANGSIVSFYKTIADGQQANDDVLGVVNFYGRTGSTEHKKYASIEGSIADITSGGCDGRIDFRQAVGNTSDTLAMRIEFGKVGIGLTSPASKLHVDQASADGAIPVLTLDQGDASEEMIEFLCTIGTGNAIEAVGAKSLTTTHFIKVTIQGGLTRYIPVGTIA